MNTEIRKADQYDKYRDARELGRTISESARNAKVSRQTGVRWEAVLKAAKIADGVLPGSVSRQELEGLYSDALRRSPPQTVAQIGAAYQKLKGFELPTDTAPMQWPSATIAYIDEEHRRLCDRQHACTQSPIDTPRSPQREANDIIESPGQNLAKKGGSDDDSHGETRND